MLSGRSSRGKQRGEERLEPVVVFLEDRIELVIVAAGTADAQAKENVAGHVGEVVLDRMPLFHDVALVVFVDPEPEEARGHHQGRIARRDLVAGKLLGDETVVGHVVVQGADDVVAIAPGLGTIGVRAVAVRLGVAHQVEPVPGPALAIPRARQQAIDQAIESAWVGIGDERLDVFRATGAARSGRTSRGGSGSGGPLPGPA